MTLASPNFTIVVNWRKKGFGCSKVCSYCTWRESSLLPHGPQNPEEIDKFIRQCKKSFVTISGGADPLYRFDEHQSDLMNMIRQIKSNGFRVRIITRELAHIHKLKGHVDFVSVSLDNDVLAHIPQHSPSWEGIDIEFSLVLPPLPSDLLLSLKPQYLALRQRLGKRLVLRENLNSIFPLDIEQMRFGHAGIVYVPKRLCLAGRYLSTIDCTGHQIVQDNDGLAQALMSDARVHLFGGFARHLLSPQHHLEYQDIDLIALSPQVKTDLSTCFGFTFTELGSATGHIRYFSGKPERAGKALHLIEMPDERQARHFVNNAQYDIDRFAFSNGQFLFDPKVGESAIRNAVSQKVAQRPSGHRDLSLFSRHRPAIEQLHRIKLIRKGFTILD